MNLNLKHWKQYRVRDIFVMYNGKGITKEEIECNPGSFPAIQSGEDNNGCIGKIDKAYCIKMGYTYTELPCLTVARSGSAGYVAYQPFGCVVGDSAKVLILKDSAKRTELIYLFLKTILMANQYKYTYGRKVTEEKYLSEIINLPADSNGEPDWNFMEKYMMSLNHKSLTTSNHRKNEVQPLDVERWKTFKIKDLFVLQIGKAHSEMLDEGNDVPYIGAKKDDNGVMCHGAYNPELVQEGNCIIFICNGQGSVGYANYMNNAFIGTTDIVAGYNSHLNQYNGLFIATVLCLERPKYSFGRKWKTHLNDTEINLPANRSGDPDWDYMENYMKSLPYGDRI